MDRTRADIGFADALDGFDPAEWGAGQGPRPRIAPEESRRAAEATGFRSREPGQGRAPDPAPEPPLLRRRRTGRNAQLNLKVRPETITAFTALADRMGWGLGETLEEGLKLLEDRYGPQSDLAPPAGGEGRRG